MDAKLAYWLVALGIMGSAVVVGVVGRYRARRGDHAGHRRYMTASGLLVIAFLASYPIKVAVLGREDLSSWSRAEVALLRLHETVVLLMLVAGVAAFRLMRRERGATVPGSRSRDVHRLLGRVAVVAAVLGLVSAGGLVGSMVNARRVEEVTRLDAGSARR